MFEDNILMWEASDQIEYEFLQQKYRNRSQLAEEWLEKRKTAEKFRLKEDGQPNPHYPRLCMEADQARHSYEMALMVARQAILERQVDIIATLHQRVAILEGAYTSLSLATQTTKVDYYNRLKGWVGDQKQPTMQPPPRPRPVGQIIDEEFNNQRSTDNGEPNREES